MYSLFKLCLVLDIVFCIHQKSSDITVVTTIELHCIPMVGPLSEKKLMYHLVYYDRIGLKR